MKELIIPLTIFGTLLLLMLLFLIVMLIMLFKQRMKKLDLKLIEEKHQHENELLKTRIELQEQALDWISREVHDNVGQMLSVTRFQLKANLERRSKLELTETAIQSADRIGACIDDLRNMTHILNGEMVQQIGLNAALEREIRFIRSLFKLECTFEHDYDFNLTGEQELLLFRLTQECLNNILKHAKATAIHISILEVGKTLKLTIQDNGQGMDVDKAMKKNGMGLRSIRHRSKMLKAKLEIDSAPEKGCIVKITLKPENDANTH